MFSKYKIVVLLVFNFIIIFATNFVFAEANTDATIGNITLMTTGEIELKPGFRSDITEYTANVNSDISNVVVRTLASSTASIVTINDKAVGFGAEQNVALAVGKNTIQIVDTAKEGVSKTYTIVIQREDIKPIADKFLKFTYTDPTTGKIMPYRLFVPDQYNPKKSYPLVLFLHGSGERGTDNEAQVMANQGATIWAKPEEQTKHPTFVLAPQSPKDGGWIHIDSSSYDPAVRFAKHAEFTDELQMVVNIIHELQAKYNLDNKRLYSTGLSIGGFGTWNLNEKYPYLFAAMVPVCGGGDLEQAYKIAKKPIWTFHAVNDPIVPVRYTQDMVKALQGHKGKPIYTEYPAGLYIKPFEHFSWVLAFQNSEMRNWLFEQKKNS